MITTTTTYAHSGRTDSSGGHRDNQNKSGLGSYHYHCGGYPAHLHSNGKCPYKKTSSNNGNNSSNSTTTNSNNSNITKEKQTANKNGYNKGYNDGYNSNAFNDATKETYSQEYKNGYKQGYDKGVNDLNTKKDEIYNKGYQDGVSGIKNNNKQTNKDLIESYNSGYKKGYDEYVIKNGEDFGLMGKEDALSFNTKKKFPPTTDIKLINSYNNSYDETLRTMELNIYELGFNKALLGEEYSIQNYEHNEEEEWFKNGYKAGIEEFELEKELAYKSGLKNQEYSPSEKFEKVKVELLKEYDLGKNKRNSKKKFIIIVPLLSIIPFANKENILKQINKK